MTDIVERLRESADGWFNEVGTRHEAADEIERLRAERDWLSKELEHMRVSYSSCDAALAQCEQNSQRIAAERDALRADAERYRWLRDTVGAFARQRHGTTATHWTRR